ncbi:UNVERIFIED_ORG: hypothetical protein BDK47_1134 [Anoxybacillus amylolyticus]
MRPNNAASGWLFGLPSRLGVRKASHRLASDRRKINKRLFQQGYGKPFRCISIHSLAAAILMKQDAHGRHGAARRLPLMAHRPHPLRCGPGSAYKCLFSYSAILPIRRAWRPPSNSVSSHALAISRARPGPMTRSPIARMLLSLCMRVSLAL